MPSRSALRFTPSVSAADGPTLAVEVPARPENVAFVRHAVADLAERAAVPSGRRGDIVLAVGEACANAVMHAYEDQPVGVLQVSGGVDGSRLRLVVADHGGGMGPRADSPGLGLGLPLMASLSSSLELRPSPGGGTEVWMAFELGPGERPRCGPRFQDVA